MLHMFSISKEHCSPLNIYQSAYSETPGCLSICCDNQPHLRCHPNLVPPNDHSVPGSSVAWKHRLEGRYSWEWRKDRIREGRTALVRGKWRNPCHGAFDPIEAQPDGLEMGVKISEMPYPYPHFSNYIYISWFPTSMRLVVQTAFDQELKPWWPM